MSQSLRKLVALAGAGVILLTSCGGSEESSGRQRNSALATCSTVSVGVPKPATVSSGGYDVATTVELCEAADSFAVIGADGSANAVQVGPDRRGVMMLLAYADRAIDVTIRLYGPNDAVIGDEVISLSLTKNEQICNMGGPCKDGDVGLGGGKVVVAPNSTELIEVPSEADIVETFFPNCSTPPDMENREKLTPSDAGTGVANTATMFTYCETQVGLLKNLKDFNDSRAIKDWVIPSQGDVAKFYDVLPYKDKVASSSISLQDSMNGKIYASASGPAGNATYVVPNATIRFVPIRYVQTVPEYAATATVVPAQVSTSGDQSGDGAGQPSDQPGSGASNNSMIPAQLASLRNFKVNVDRASGTWKISFDYSDDELAAADALNISIYEGNNYFNGFTMSKNTWTSEGETRSTTSIDASSYQVDTVYKVMAYASRTRLVPMNDGNMVVGDLSESAAIDVVLNSGVTNDAAAPRTPKDLRADENNPLTLRWNPDREAVNDYQYSPGVYPYTYILYWREKSDAPNESNPFNANTHLYGPSFTFQPNHVTIGKEYEFKVAEVNMESNPPELISAPTEVFSHIPYPVGFVPPTFGNSGDLTNQLSEEELEAIYANCAKAPTVLTAVNDDHEVITSGITSDDRIILSATHECATSPNGETNIYIEWRDPDNGERNWYIQTTAWIQSPVIFHGAGRLKAGPQTFYAQARWNTSTKTFFTPRTKLTLDILQGTKPFSKPCKPDDVAVEGNVLRVDCEKVKDLSFERFTNGTYDVTYAENSNELDISKLPPGWNKGSMWIAQADSYGDIDERFVLMVCRTECENTTAEKEFTIEQKGDSVVATVKQNDCGGNPEAELEEFFKAKGNAYYSYNRYFNDEEPELKPGKALTLELQPATAGLLTERDDYCDLIDGQRKYSFIVLDRTPAANPPAEAPTARGATVAELTRAEVGSGSAVPILLSPEVTTLTVGADAMAKLLSGLSDEVAAVSVSVDGGPFQVLGVGESNDLVIGKKAKKITFKVTGKDGTSVLLDKTIVRPEFEVVEAAAANQGQQVSAPVVVSTGGAVGDSGSSPVMYIVIAVLVLLMLGGGATVVRKRKTSTVEAQQ